MTPTCSNYARIVIMRKGFFVGTILAILRIIHCRPSAAGVYDPPNILMKE